MDKDNESISTELIPIFEVDEMIFFLQRVAGRKDNFSDGGYELVGDVYTYHRRGIRMTEKSRFRSCGIRDSLGVS